MSIDPLDPAMAGVTVRVTHRGQREDKGRVCRHCGAWTLRAMMDASNPTCMRCGAALAIEPEAKEG
jgi:ribosomal protein L40E